MGFLSPGEDQSSPGVVVFFDCETFPTTDEKRPGVEEHRLRLGVAVAGRIEGGVLTRRKEIVFHDQAELWSWINYVRHPREPLWIWAHNLNFDLTVAGFWNRIDSGEFTLNRQRYQPPSKTHDSNGHRKPPKFDNGMVISHDPPSAVSCWHRDGWRVTFVDSLNWFELSLSKLGSMIHWPKLPMPPGDAAADDWVRYCRRDVEILERSIVSLLDWWRKNELGKFTLTLASGAFAAFRYRFMHHDIRLPESEEQRTFERGGAYTGRTEALRLIDTSPPAAGCQTNTLIQRDLFRPPAVGKFHLLDATSFYGCMASETLLPVKTVQRWRESTDGELAFGEIGGDCCARVLIRHQTERFPLRTADQVIWPIGEYETTLMGQELERALRCGAVQRVLEAVRYELAPVLREFAWGIWGDVERAIETGDDLAAYLGKQMLARISGKFAQHGHVWQTRPNMIPSRPWSHWTEVSTTTGTARHYRAIGWMVQERIDAEDPDHCWPAIFGFITAAGRETLLTWWKVAGEAHTYYLATDALIVDEQGRQNLDLAGFLHPTAMGFLRPKITSDHLVIRGPGSYEIGDKKTYMGRPIKGRELAPGVWTSPRFQSFVGTLSRHGGDSIAVTQSVTSIPRRCAVGTVGPEGWITPIRVAP